MRKQRQDQRGRERSGSREKPKRSPEEPAQRPGAGDAAEKDSPTQAQESGEPRGIRRRQGTFDESD